MALVVTSSYFTRLPLNHVRIGVSCGKAKRLLQQPFYMTELAPWSAFKKGLSTAGYRDAYMKQLLKLDPCRILYRIDRAVGEGSVAVLCCYESPEKDTDWCHRGYISQWLADQLGVVVPELGLDPELFGDRHPKIPREFRK